MSKAYIAIPIAICVLYWSGWFCGLVRHGRVKPWRIKEYTITPRRTVSIFHLLKLSEKSFHTCFVFAFIIQAGPSCL
jgi:hypothetical protein